MIVFNVSNVMFFRIVDKLIHEAMRKVEEKHLLPIAERLVDETGIALGNYPVEGYYGSIEKSEVRLMIVLRSEKVVLFK